MVLAEPAGRVGAGGVEVAQPGGSQPVQPVGPVAARARASTCSRRRASRGRSGASSPIGRRRRAPNSAAVEDSTKRRTPWRDAGVDQTDAGKAFSTR